MSSLTDAFARWPSKGGKRRGRACPTCGAVGHGAGLWQQCHIEHIWCKTCSRYITVRGFKRHCTVLHPGQTGHVGPISTPDGFLVPQEPTGGDVDPDDVLAPVERIHGSPGSHADLQRRAKLAGYPTVATYVTALEDRVGKLAARIAMRDVIGGRG